MSIKHRLFFIILLFLSVLSALLPTVAYAKTPLIKQAYTAYEKKANQRLAKYVNQLKSNDDDLAPYAEYWHIKRTANTTSAQKIRSLLQRAEDYAFYTPLQAEYLNKLGRLGQWGQFLDYYTSYQGKDTRVQCRYWEAQAIENGNINTAAVLKLWHYPKRRPSACNGLFDLMRAKGIIKREHLYTRIRMAALNGHTTLAKNLAVKLPKVNSKVTRLFDRARKSPQRFITKKTVSFQKPLGAIINLYAIDRVARNNTNKAAKLLRSVEHEFSKQNRLIAWEVIAYRAARNLDQHALQYYQNTYQHQDLPEYLQTNDFYLARHAWRARAALRVENWQTLLNVYQQMPQVQQKKARWRYWSARAMHARHAGQEKYQKLANTVLSTLGQERHYYGWLAAEEVGFNKEGYYQKTAVNVDQKLIETVKHEVNIQRAVALHRAGVQTPARKTWYHAIRNYSDQTFLAAARYAQQIGWHDISINTADRTKLNHDFNLRYPKPHAQAFHRAAANEALDESWVLGLVRQESRFIDYAKSRVGAAGLMQLMPKTARWVARKKGMRYQKKKLYEPATNIALGTYYMRYTLDLLGGNAVLATAGYNAGPSRALKWMAKRPLEAAIYIETIPFDETRNYVQRVMANAHFYETRAGVPNQTIQQRIGIIPAKHQ